MFIASSYPTAAGAIGGPAVLLMPIALIAIALIGGFLVFDREAPKVAEQL